MRSDQVYDGKPYVIDLDTLIGPNEYNYIEECCDCSLVHLTKFQVLKNNCLLITHWRDDRETDKQRKKNKIKVRQAKKPEATKTISTI